MASKKKPGALSNVKIASGADVDARHDADNAASRRTGRSRGRKVATTTGGLKLGSSYGGGSFGGSLGGGGSGNVIGTSAMNFFSPQLSTDFLELPQTERERREWYRFFANTDPLVGQALDILTELPLSKMILGKPKCKDEKKAKEISAFFENMVKNRINLFRKIIDIVYHYWLFGNVFIWIEDSSDTDDENYKGWEKIFILPIDQVKVRRFGFTDEYELEYIPSDEDKRIVRDAATDPMAARAAKRIPDEIQKYILSGENVPLDTDPKNGSFCYHLSRRRQPNEELGHSILERCLRVLLFRDKLRQAQTSIASRHMTPIRVVYGENLSDQNVEELREQVDLALMDPDFSIVANYEVVWNEMGSENRLLDLSNEYDITDRQLMIGLGLTPELLTGETTYGGSRITLEVMNTRFLLFREVIQDFIEEFLFKPVAIRKGFVEKDEFGYETVIYPPVKFSRIALRDNADVFDSLMQLYQKGSLSVDFILDLFNIDAVDVKEKLIADVGTINDATFNEFLRALYNGIADSFVTGSDFAEKVAKGLNITLKKPEEGDDRFGG